MFSTKRLRALTTKITRRLTIKKLIWKPSLQLSKKKAAERRGKRQSEEVDGADEEEDDEDEDEK